MARTLVDSSVVIALGNPTDAHYQTALGTYAGMEKPDIRISVVSYAEALIAPARRGANQFELAKRQLHNYFREPIEVSKKIAALSAQIRAEYRMSTPNSLILATALEHEMDLWTFDKKLFEIFTARK